MDDYWHASLLNRDAMYKKLKVSPENAILKLTYKRCRNYCTKIVKKLRWDYDRTELSKAGNDNKKIWQIIKSVMNTATPKNQTADLLVSSASPQQSVNSINKLFVDIGKNFANFYTQENLVKGPSFATDTSAPPLHSFLMVDTDESASRLGMLIIIMSIFNFYHLLELLPVALWSLSIFFTLL